MQLYITVVTSPSSNSGLVYDKLRIYINAPFPLDFSWTSLSLKVRLKNMVSTPSLLSSPKPSWQLMRHGLLTEVLSFKHRSSNRYLEMSQECRTFRSIGSNPCDWLLLYIVMRAQRTSLTNTDGKVDEWWGIWPWFQKKIQHVNAW